MTRFEIGTIYGSWLCEGIVPRPGFADQGLYRWVNIDTGVRVEGQGHPEPDQIKR